ncbi:SIMPL domain-containing protein [Nocardia sp. CDC153]|uniref:SIMPL domain-containing protein n=1 Tax=Nocardia sp. CDC153 TaxID=3112167 RepID=UPI002DB9B054|nr:SIMPL domain-containing protein [Nocardia sp. CDC153]MEC3953872.1 SIMPL domain-containing protein [Nocardia sp. CDC153]
MTSENAIGTITMIGSGSASATPDIMRVNISVETRADTVAAAYARAGQRADAVIGALRADGVAGRDINTSGLTVRADTVWTDGNREQLVGYIAGTSLTVTLRDIAADNGEAKSDETGPAAIIAHAVDAGGDDVRLGGLTLAVADEEALMVRARDAAWDHALGKAEQYVYRASRTLGPVVEITENISGPAPQPRIAFAANKSGGYAESIPVELGESELSTTIRVTWQLT